MFGVGITPSAHSKLEEVLAYGRLERSVFDAKVMERILDLTENQFGCACDEMVQALTGGRTTVKSPAGYFIGIMSKYLKGDRDHVIDSITGAIMNPPVRAQQQPPAAAAADPWAQQQGYAGYGQSWGGGYEQGQYAQYYAQQQQ
ncbi:hypothetical protein TeGR_g2276 [Tetraparma gracilis]|jgi:hypothetical protein|uniref:Uncharacterized protein n=1 Tax=Tetraparma gracilis TaxID=2962635 RepID=A0ABQ6N1H9_9STRA|nr:hypothetical protein TeGR_g2276 [Tetraparma gracilis]